MSLKKMGKTGKETEELTGVRRNPAGEICTAYQREGDSSMEPKKCGFRKGMQLLLTSEEQAKIREAVITHRPAENALIYRGDEAGIAFRSNCERRSAPKGQPLVLLVETDRDRLNINGCKRVLFYVSL